LTTRAGFHTLISVLIGEASVPRTCSGIRAAAVAFGVLVALSAGAKAGERRRLVTAEFAKTPLGNVLDTISRQTGREVGTAADEIGIAAVPVTLSLVDAGFGEAVARTSIASGVGFRPVVFGRGVEFSRRASIPSAYKDAGTVLVALYAAIPPRPGAKTKSPVLPLWFYFSAQETEVSVAAELSVAAADGRTTRVKWSGYRETTAGRLGEFVIPAEAVGKTGTVSVSIAIRHFLAATHRANLAPRQGAKAVEGGVSFEVTDFQSRGDRVTASLSARWDMGLVPADARRLDEIRKLAAAGGGPTDMDKKWLDGLAKAKDLRTIKIRGVWLVDPAGDKIEARKPKSRFSLLTGLSGQVTFQRPADLKGQTLVVAFSDEEKSEATFGFKGILLDPKAEVRRMPESLEP
jgi:hypothetical protein